MVGGEEENSGASTPVSRSVRVLILTGVAFERMTALHLRVGLPSFDLFDFIRRGELGGAPV